MKYELKLLFHFGSVVILSACTAAAQPVLSGVSLYVGSSDGTPGWKHFWNTRGNDIPYNLYCFTGSPDSPVFLTSGNNDLSLIPNLALPIGEHVVNFAGDVGAYDFVGLNLFFGTNLLQPRITAVVAADGSTNFNVVAAHIMTGGLEYKVAVPSAGSLTYIEKNYQVTLSGFSLSTPLNRDLVSEYSLGPDGVFDTIGTFTLSVTEGPPQLRIDVSQVRLCWDSLANVEYQLQYSSAETTNLWTDLGSPVSGTGSLLWLTADVVPGRSQRLYRLRSLPAP
jgi:hypothetical protein